MSDVQSAAPASAQTNAAGQSAPSEANASEINNTEQTAAVEASDGQEFASEEQIESDPNLSKSEKQSLKKQLKLKVDGQEIIEEVDFGDEDYVTKQLQLAKVAQKRMQETAVLKKEVSQLLEMLETDPALALEKLGINPEEFSHQYLSKKVEEMKKSPEQLAKEKLESELNQLKRELEKRDNDAREAEMARLQAEFSMQIDQDITSALSEQSDLPKSPYVVKRIADMMMLAINNGNPNVSAKDVVPIVRKQIKRELQDMFGMMPEDLLETAIGKQNVERMRKKRLATAKKAPVDTAKSIKSSGNDVLNRQESAKPKQKVSAKDFFRKL
jgi:hypothetical protein